MRRDARGCRPLSSERGGGKTGSAAQNLPRFSSVATTVPGDLCADFSPEPPEDLSDFPKVLPACLPADLPGVSTGLPDLPEDLPDFPALASLPDLFPLDP
jgi:hypothetical protein